MEALLAKLRDSMDDESENFDYPDSELKSNLKKIDKKLEDLIKKKKDNKEST